MGSEMKLHTFYFAMQVWLIQQHIRVVCKIGEASQIEQMWKAQNYQLLQTVL